jgi:nitrate reductase gamma subunit
VHIWSAPVWYLGRRGYQVVRARKPMGQAEASLYASKPLTPAE